MNHTNLVDKLDKLKHYHQQLDTQINIGYTNYLDDQQLTKMKHEKLLVKRSIDNIRTQLGL